MSNQIEVEINSLISPTHCHICNAFLLDSNNSFSHYASPRHSNNVKEYRKIALEKLQQGKSTKVVTGVQKPEKVQVTKQETMHCQICNIKFDKNLANQHYQDTEHKRNKERYCSVCNILTISKEQLWEHIHGSRHKTKLEEIGLPAINGQYSPSDSTLPVELKNRMLADICQICNTKFPAMKHALDHYISQKHKSLVRRWFKERKENKILSRSNNKTVAERTNRIVQISKTVPKIVDYNCYACKIIVQTELEKDDHRTTIPHTELARLKSDMVSKGVIKEYWVRLGSTILCTLCNIQLSSASDVNKHFNEPNHCIKLNNWWRKLDFTKVPSDSDTKLFYCKICDKPLDCTSESEKHYLGFTHEKKSELYCVICKVPNPTPEIFELHNRSTLHMETARKNGIAIRAEAPKLVTNTPMLSCRREAETTDKPPQTNLENKKSTLNRPTIIKDSEVTNSESDANLRGQVFEEIEKLIDAIYVSKKVPFNVVLEYLKKVNGEFAILQEKYEKKQSRDLIVQEDDKEVGNHDDQHLSTDNESYSFNSNSVSRKQTETVYNLIDLSDILPAQKNNVALNFPDKKLSSVDSTDIYDNFGVTESNIENYSSDKASCSSDKNNENDNNQQIYQKTEYLNQKENYLQLKTSKNFESMLKEIALLKKQVEERYPNEENLEKDVLNEIEKLVTLVRSDDIPPDVTLRYLQDFNKELDFQDFIERM